MPAESWRSLLSPLALALCFTLLNAFKPLHIDDPGYYLFAKQISENPTAPYDFTVSWDSVRRPAIEILAPPVVPYWWGLGICLFGDRPVLWKLWQLPFSLLLVFALAALLRRFVGAFETPLLWMTVLSPTLLPGFNLMADVPALALGLFALTLFCRGVDVGSPAAMALAGLIAGLAMQTKYSMFVIPALLLLYGCLNRRAGLGMLAASLGVAVFVAWETFLLHTQGDSHFLRVAVVFEDMRRPLFDHVLSMALPLLLLGSLAPAVLLLALAALGWSARRLTMVGAFLLLGFVLLATVPERHSWQIYSPRSGWPRFTPMQVCFGGIGMGLLAAVAAVAGRLLQNVDRSARAGPFWLRLRLTLADTSLRIELFLAGWLVLEVAAYFVLSPFPAARRVIGLTVVSTLLVGRLTARSCRGRVPATVVRSVAAANVLLGITICGVDYLDAWASQSAAEMAAHHVEPGSKGWYLGCWGFGYYAERAGLKPLVCGESQCRRGDFLVVDDHYYLFHPPLLVGTQGYVVPVATLHVEDSIPVRTVMDYYSGWRPLSRLEGPRASATVYRVTTEFVPRYPH